MGKVRVTPQALVEGFARVLGGMAALALVGHLAGVPADPIRLLDVDHVPRALVALLAGAFGASVFLDGGRHRKGSLLLRAPGLLLALVHLTECAIDLARGVGFREGFPPTTFLVALMLLLWTARPSAAAGLPQLDPNRRALWNEVVALQRAAGG